MSTQFLLRRHVVHPQEELRIEESDYLQLVQARSTLVDAFAFEQKYNLLKENFVALEIAATEWSLRATIESDFSYRSISSVMEEASRYLMNVLTAARAYSDQVKQDFKHLPLSLPFAQQAEESLARHYDSSADFRLMEALRNHALHFGPPVHVFSGNTTGTAADWTHAVSIRVSKAQLAEDKAFKSSVLAEMPSAVDLRLAARAYVQSISRVHIYLRAVVQPSVEGARGLVDRWIGRFLVLNESAYGLHAHKIVDGTDDPAPVLLMVEWDDVRVSLAAKNEGPIQLAGKSANHAS